MANQVNVTEMISKGYAGVAAEAETKQEATEKELPPAEILSQGYAEAHPTPAKATKAKTVEIADGE